MKKRLSAILALVLALCAVLPLAACGSNPGAEFIRGTRTDTAYVNESMNLTFTLPEGMIFCADGQADGDAEYEFMAVDLKTGCNVIMCIGEISARTSMASYIESFKKTNGESDGQPTSFSDKTEKVRLGGSTFEKLTGTSSPASVAVKTYYYFLKMGTTMITFIVIGGSGDTAERFEQCFAEASGA